MFGCFAAQLCPDESLHQQVELSEQLGRVSSLKQCSLACATSLSLQPSSEPSSWERLDPVSYDS